VIDYLNLLVELIILGLLIYILRKEYKGSFIEPIATPKLKPYAKIDKNAKRVPKAFDDQELYEREQALRS
jgi:hypothetical protein